MLKQHWPGRRSLRGNKLHSTRATPPNVNLATIRPRTSATPSHIAAPQDTQSDMLFNYITPTEKHLHSNANKYIPLKNPPVVSPKKAPFLSFHTLCGLSTHSIFVLFLVSVFFRLVAKLPLWNSFYGVHVCCRVSSIRRKGVYR